MCLDLAVWLMGPGSGVGRVDGCSDWRLAEPHWFGTWELHFVPCFLSSKPDSAWFKSEDEAVAELLACPFLSSGSLFYPPA